MGPRLRRKAGGAPYAEPVLSPLRTLSAVVLCGALLFSAGCEPVETGPSTDRPTGKVPVTTVPTPDVGGLTQLATLKVASWHSMNGYSRDRFPHWVSQGEHCDTREVVLKRDGTGVKTDANCKVTAGRWVSPYDDKVVTKAIDLDIDHMVALANAWRTGAWDWTDDKRSAFANDLTRPQLLAVTLQTNRSKGDQDPSEWRPPLRDYWCEYAQSWISVKAFWKLNVTDAEKFALQEMLETC